MASHHALFGIRQLSVQCNNMSSIDIQRSSKLTVDSLLGTSEVNGLDTTSLLELACNSRAGSSLLGTSIQSRHESALLSGSSSQLAGGLAQSAGNGS